MAGATSGCAADWASPGTSWTSTAPHTNVTTRRSGAAFAIGLGYDARVGRKISITPQLDFMAQRYDTHDERVVSFGIGITFH
jgi:hypothetical protein